MSRIARALGLVLEERFCRLSDGRVFSPSGFGDQFWQRYLSSFDCVLIIARLAHVERAESTWAEIRDPRVAIRGLPTYVGPLQFFSIFPKVLRSLLQACKEADAIVVRAPGTLSLLVLTLLRHPPNARKPVAVELVGDPIDVFGAGVGGRLSGLLKHVFEWSTKRLCVQADAVSYVTQRTLQARYPPRPNVMTISCSSVELPLSALSSEHRQRVSPFPAARVAIIFTAASLEAPYKGIDVLIAAAAHLVATGLTLRVRIAGEGRLRLELEAMAKRLAVEDSVVFLGRLDRNAVMSEMRGADLYVQPSLTEGLPRAVIEACATAAPVVASRVGGIPELLHADDMVTPGDARELAERIMETLTDPTRMVAMSARNLATSREYLSTILDARRGAFYAELRQLTGHKGNN
ncbi:MAG: glycosyltransferase [Roseovarius sp.]|jgi:glycosyltransferase involved in cell wall biosynthesis|nr:glycosyltransferase [Roseovarius sp.]